MVIKKALRIQQKILYLAQVMGIYRLSKGMIGIFLPFLILQNGGTLLMVAGLYLIWFAGKLSLNFPAMRLIQRHGAHFGLTTGFIFEIAQLGSIFGFVNTHALAFLILAGVGGALADAFKDNSRHMYMPRVMEDHAKSSSIATLEIIGQAADLVGPIVGAVIGVLFGGEALLVAALLVLAATYFPLRHMGRMAVFDGTPPIQFTLRAAPKRDLVANFCQCSEEAVALDVWPIYLAIFLGTFESIGAVAAITALVTMVVVWFAGHRGDRGRLEPVLRQGTYAMSATNLLRIVALTPVPIAVVGSAYMAAREYMSNPWNATFYTHARRKGLQYTFAVETAAALGYTFVWSVLFVLILVLDDTRTVFIVAFALAAAMIWGTFLFTRIDGRKRAPAT